MTDFIVECVGDEAHFLALRERWNALAATTRPACVFLRHEWFDAAWQWRRNDSELRLYCVRRGNETIGIVPCLLRTELRARLPLRVLQFLTVPDTQLCEVLAAPDDLGAVVETVVAEWRRTRRAWDLIDLGYLPPDGSLLDVMRGACTRHGLTTTARTAGYNPWIALRDGWTSFYAGRSRRLKKANNLIANRLRRSFHAVEVRWRTAANLDPASFRETLGELVSLSANSWKRSTGLTLDQPGPNAFIHRLAQHAYANGWLSVWLLRLNGQAAAGEFQICYEGQVHALRADYNEALAQHSPGSYLNSKLIEGLFGNGLERYWMGPGDNPYKAHWTDTSEALTGLRIYGTTLRGKLLELWDRRLRAWLRSKLSAARPQTKRLNVVERCAVTGHTAEMPVRV